jgi:1-acyl-sn-glycerol-3-phosphate acyltransferase
VEVAPFDSEPAPPPATSARPRAPAQPSVPPDDAAPPPAAIEVAPFESDRPPPSARHAPAARARAAEPIDDPLSVAPPPDEGEDADDESLYAVEETIDRFFGDVAASSADGDRDARRRAAEAFAQVAAHLGGAAETDGSEGALGARELLRPGYYVRQWGRRGSADRIEDVDELGLDRAYEARYRPLFEGLYHRWFRTTARGLENVPAEGRCLVVANHAGALPWDGLMLRTAFRLEHPAKRDLRWLAEDFVSHAPFLGAFVNRVGAVRACPENAERLLAKESLVAVFPEGEKGVGKPFTDRYELQRFGRGGYVKLAIRTKTPIVPTAIVGSEEAHPMLFRTGAIAKLVGLPFLPVTPTFPWLGPLGLVPLPTRWAILCGEPIHLEDEDGDPDDPILVAHLNDRVRTAVQELVRRALQLRGQPFP